MNRKIAVIISLFTVLFSCNDYTPKPRGYNRIEDLSTERSEYVFKKFSFEYSSAIRIDSLKSVSENEIWFNIAYPYYGAVVYCTYLPITKTSLTKALEDSYHMAYSHTQKADGIEQNLYDDPQNRISGILYEIEGDVATPLQFFVTDSTKHFLRGSFYYLSKVNTDSVAPVTAIITNDIEAMMSSLRWKD